MCSYVNMLTPVQLILSRISSMELSLAHTLVSSGGWIISELQWMQKETLAALQLSWGQ